MQLANVEKSVDGSYMVSIVNANLEDIFDLLDFFLARAEKDIKAQAEKISKA